jgi:hypothetical protein
MGMPLSCAFHRRSLRGETLYSPEWHGSSEPGGPPRSLGGRVCSAPLRAPQLCLRESMGPAVVEGVGSGYAL